MKYFKKMYLIIKTKIFVQMYANNPKLTTPRVLGGTVAEGGLEDQEGECQRLPLHGTCQHCSTENPSLVGTMLLAEILFLVGKANNSISKCCSLKDVPLGV